MRDLLVRRAARLYLGSPKSISLEFTDKFGDLVVKRCDEVTDKIRVVPWKISGGEGNPQKVYKYIKETVVEDINLLIGHIIPLLNENFRLTETFSHQLQKDFPPSPSFIINLLEQSVSRFRIALEKLFQTGPIHREMHSRRDYHGSRLYTGSSMNLSPYRIYIKSWHDHETILNRMISQTAYYLMCAAELVGGMVDGERSELCQTLFRSAAGIMDRYHLWAFFTIDILEESRVIERLISQGNRLYNEIYSIFRIIRDTVIYLNLIHPLQGDGVEMPLQEFYSVYETWAISRIWDKFRQMGFHIKSVEKSLPRIPSSKMSIRMERGNESAMIIWEVKLNAIEHSTYYGDLLQAFGGGGSVIKPDITVLYESEGHKRALVGDVKFSVTDTGLPRLESVYKVLSYVEDLRKSPLFRGWDLEGLLVYPGMVSPVTVPSSQSGSHIHVFPLNTSNREFGLFR
ncbi:hypothetical protein [Methanothermobacter sp. K4]|uniref:hypothetical protein n=1 Tax=Methanothermobacter sp. K4 TaxID=2913262 RepID=UPI001EDACF87|nr:hypothetical protein [Methanothermobacter sp. K4]